ncbi:MAG: gliding motility-associated C-terminal domain-containing protein [Bacteroidota bacterium]
MFRICLLVFLSVFSGLSFSQGSSCFQIESILVDGCDGGNESKNEMVLFQNGPNSMNVNDLRIDGASSNGVIQTGKWPTVSNDFLGFCTNGAATTKLNTLNAAITQCGFLKEPTNGVLPANAHILIMTSTDFTAIPSYFQNLSDTLYVIFQCDGNSIGHFTNFGAQGERTLVITNTVTNCADTVTYEKSLLIQEDGTLGSQDGGSVAFDNNGNANYFNNGCEAPIVPSSVSFVASTSICFGDFIDIIAQIDGSYSTLVWSGGTGTFSNTDNDSIRYTPTQNETGLVTLNLKAFDPCGNLKIDEDYSFTIAVPAPINITPQGSTSLCLGDSVVLVASGSLNYLWSTTESNDTIAVKPISDSTFILIGALSNGCPTIDSIEIFVQVCIPPVIDTVDFGLQFPNIFTPNADSKNDFYVPVAFTGVTNKGFVIINRWGEIMYETTDQIIKWDGKSQDGKEASEGVYFYKLLYNEPSKEDKILHGFLHLERK